jgi:O-Antigen ligase
MTKYFLCLVCAILFLSHPEFFLFLLIIFTIYYYLVTKNHKINLKIIFALSLVATIGHFSIFADPFLTAINLFFTIIVFLSAINLNILLSFSLKRYVDLILVSLGGVFFLSYLILVSLPGNPFSLLGLRPNQAIITALPFSMIVSVKPIASENEYVYKTFLAFSEGKNTAIIRIRGEKRHLLVFSIQSAVLKNGYGTPTVCHIEVYWKNCVVSENFSSPASASVYIGAFGTWRKSDPSIEIQSLNIRESNPMSFLQRFRTLPRFSASSFSENAFGAHMIIFSLLLLNLSKIQFKLIFITFPSIFLAFLSGSRGAITALFAGIIIFFTFQSRLFRFLPIIFVFGSVTFALLQFQTVLNTSSVPLDIGERNGVRSLNILDRDSTQTRLAIWRLAFKAWVENPRTFLIGAGDLTNAMKAKFDASSSSFGLTKDSLTHAHNLWLQTAGESGLLGLCAMLGLWIWVILRAWRARDGGALALLSAIFVINSVDYLFFYTPVYLAFWMSAAGLKQPEATPVPLESSAVVTP